jgi:hypothetical protein
MTRVEFLAMFAKRLMGASTRDTFQEGFRAFGVAMSLFGTSPADLWFRALIGHVASYFLAVVALLRALSSFKWLCVSRLPSGVKESFLEEASRVRSFVEVYQH